jgi:hypothetical protein
VQREVVEAVVPRPAFRRRDERAACATSRRAPRDSQLADVPVPLAGEVPARPHADDAGDRAAVRDDEDRSVTGCRRGERVFEPPPPGGERFGLVPPRRHAFREPRGQREDPFPVAVARRPDAEVRVVHADSLPFRSWPGKYGLLHLHVRLNVRE